MLPKALLSYEKKLSVDILLKIFPQLEKVMGVLAEFGIEGPKAVFGRGEASLNFNPTSFVITKSSTKREGKCCWDITYNMFVSGSVVTSATVLPNVLGFDLAGQLAKILPGVPTEFHDNWEIKGNVPQKETICCQKAQSAK